MTKFEGTYLTNDGCILSQKKGIEKIEFTKATTGCGKYLSKNEIKELKDLKDERQVFDLNSYSRSTDDSINIQFYISNSDLEQSYDLTEIGIWAIDTDGNEILYCVAFAFSNNSESIPDNSGPYQYMVRINIEVAVSNDVEVIIQKNEHFVDDYFSKDSEFPVKNKTITEMLLNMLNPIHVETGYSNVFENERVNALSSDEIDLAINTEWNGESSSDTYALKSEDIVEAISIPWSGESSTNSHALSASHIERIIN